MAAGSRPRPSSASGRRLVRKTSAVDEQLLQPLPRLGLAQVEDDAALAPVVLREGGVREVLADAERAEGAAHRVAVRRLHLDDVGAPVGQQRAGRRRGDPDAHLDHAQPGEGGQAGRSVRRRCACPPVIGRHARPAGGLVPEHVLEHLAGGVERQRVHDLHDPGHLVVGHLVPAPFDDVVARDVPGHDDEGHAHLAQPLIGDADHRGLLHGGVPQQRVLDFGGVGVEAPDDEHVLDPADDAEAAGLVQLAEVPGAQPAVRRQHLRRLLGVVEVARHDAAAAEQHLARLPGLDVVAVLADDAQLEARPRPAHGGGDGLGVVVRRTWRRRCPPR